MKIDRERIEAHARERLQGRRPRGPPRAPLRLQAVPEAGDRSPAHAPPLWPRGLEIASARSHQVDQVVAHACRLAVAGAEPPARLALAGCAVVALGGYGRAELSPFSDVDLLFLHQGRAAEAVRRFVEQVLQLLWDVGLTVGHSFRTLAECLEEARGDLHSRTALAEARLVTGDTTVFGRSTGPWTTPYGGTARRARPSSRSSAQTWPSATSGSAGRCASRSRTSRKAWAACATSTRSSGWPRPDTAAAAWPTPAPQAFSPRGSKRRPVAPTTSCSACAPRPTSPPAARRTC